MSENILFVVPEKYKNTGGLRLLIDNYADGLAEYQHNVKIIELPYRVSSSSEKKRIKEELNSIIYNNNISVVIPFTLNHNYFIMKNCGINSICANSIAFMMDSMTLHAVSVLKCNRTLKERLKILMRFFLYRYKERRCLRYYSKIIYVSNVDKRYVESVFKISDNKVFYIPNGIETTEYTALPEKPCAETLKIGFLTGFSQETLDENVYPFVMRSFPEIKKKFNDVSLVIGGKGASDAVKRKLESVEGVKYIGFVSDLKDFYSEVDIVVTCVLKKCGIINRVLEAWSYKKTVVGYSHNFATFNDAKNGVHYLSADSAEEFVTVFKDIRGGKIDTVLIASNAYKLVEEKYSWDNSVKKLINIIGI